MEYYAGIDVSLESASLCVVDATGRIVREAKVASEPETLLMAAISVALNPAAAFAVGLPLAYAFKRKWLKI